MTALEMMRTLQGSCAATEAKRGASSKIARSPKYSPGPLRRQHDLAILVVTQVGLPASPASMTNKAFPSSPSLTMTAPLG